VCEGYRELARLNESERWKVIDANKSMDEVWSQVKIQVEGALLTAGFIERPNYGPENRG
jgi:thymidylate kinase